MYRLQALYDKARKDAEIDLNARLESLTNELDTKWSERLRWAFEVNDLCDRNNVIFKYIVHCTSD